ncbi:glycosyl hydrolase [Silvimonas soli]|uniref:glycosyl hydrolase n=1 Tax=Silvimonas soli TaxID=2980100 RepID=UPI0024B3B267|nr:glycosyl hydrolase [Silvimonas soli]
MPNFNLIGDCRRAFAFLLVSVCLGLASCGGGGGSAGSTGNNSSNAAPITPTPAPALTPTPSPTPTSAPASKSAKRGIAYDLASSQDMAAVATGASWWYNWGQTPNSGIPTDYQARYGMDFYPMLWNGNFVDANVISWLQVHPSVKYLLVLNEPNLVDQANMTPAQAAALWPRYEAISAATGVKLVGPAMNWGTMAGYSDPVVWLDAFYAAYQAANGNRNPQIDYLAFHWYDYGLGAQLDRLTKYGKPFWVTEFANWHSSNDGAQIDTLAKQEAQMADMVATCETRSDVFRYAWFTGRINPDPHFDSLLAGSGILSDLGSKYLTQPW